MRSVVKVLYIIIVTAASAGYSQTKPETVFITVSDPDEKPAPEYFFSQLAVSIPLRGNPSNGQDDGYPYNGGEKPDETVFDYVLPDGLSAHMGYGVHFRSWVAISANAGIDWIASEKLVTAPVYMSLLFNPQIWEEYNVYLQAGYGKAFALGRGDLAGDYMKFRIGLVRDNEGSLFLDLSGYDFPLHGNVAVPVFSIGFSGFYF
jgi:hypothetical protein